MAVTKTGKSVEESLVVNSRSFSDKEFAEHVRHSVSCIASGQRGVECGDVLRDLYRYIACRDERRSFSDELLKQLKSMIAEPGKSPKLLRLSAMLLLRELSPTVGYSIKISNLSADVNWLPLVFPLIFAQGQELGHIALHVPIFIRWVKSSSGSNPILRRNALLCLYSILNNYGVHLLNEGQVTTVNELMLRWLTDASLSAAPNPYQRTIFNKAKLQAVRELDGAICQSFFTVLNIAHYCFPDQYLNIYTFSILRQWLFKTWHYQAGLKDLSIDVPNLPTDLPMSTANSFSEPSFFGDRMMRTPGVDNIFEGLPDHISSSPSFTDITQAFSDNSGTPVKEMADDYTSERSNLSNMRQVFGSESSFFSDHHQDGSLASESMSYCYRLLRQSEYEPSTSQDALLKKACIIEAVSMMDFFCSKEKDLVPKAIQAIRRIHSVVKMWTSPWTDVLIPIVMFFINHGEAVILDSEPYIKYLFGDVLFYSFTSPEVSFEIVNFCFENVEKLQQSTNIFSKYFPNILKILAWFPKTFQREFKELLPAMISEKSFIEMFHFLLDLPCLSAALETIKQAQKRSVLMSESTAMFRKALFAYEDIQYKPLFSFILRQEANIADTIDKLDVLHSLLEDCVTHPRVLASAKVSSSLLKVYFKTVFQLKNMDIVRKLFPVILERVTSLFNVNNYEKYIQSLLAAQILKMFQFYPSLLLDYSDELIEFVHRMNSLDNGFEEFFTNLVWIIGEYASSKYDERCGNTNIIKFHEAVESVTYELGLCMNVDSEQEICSSRLVCVLMSSLAKLASRCQDLIPKVILCISKVSKIRSECCVDQGERECLLVRANELISLLKLPNIAPLILTSEPSIKDGRLHRDRHTSMTYFLDATKEMMFT